MNNLINIIIEYSKLSQDDKDLFKTIINKDSIPVRNKDSNADFEAFKELLKRKDTTPPMVGTGKTYPTSPYFPPTNPIISYYSSKEL